MNIQIKSSNGISVMPIDTWFLADRNVFLGREITFEKVLLFLIQTLYLINKGIKAHKHNN